MAPLDLLAFLGGLLAVTVGADGFVRGASLLAGRWGVSPLVVGLTIVAFGTSAPELVVSGAAAIRQQPGLAVGNVMGSTVANVGLIVGLGALVRPMQVHRRLIVREGPLLVFVLAIVMVLSLNDALGRLDGLALVTGFAIYLVFLVRWARAEQVAEEDRGIDLREMGTRRRAGSSSLVAWLRVILGLGLLLFGANWLLDGAVALARTYHVPEEVIGATVVAVGTSLPELASTIAAAARGLGDLALGNVIGSNVFNLGLVLGAAALASPLRLPPMTVVRQVVPALVFCVAILAMGYFRARVSRWEAVLLLIGYGGFLLWATAN